MLIWYIAPIVSVLTVFIIDVLIYITYILHEGYLILCKRCVNARMPPLSIIKQSK